MGLNTIKQALKKNKSIDAISRILAYPMFAMEYRKSDKAADRRSKGYDDPQYLWLKQYKDKYKGKRCFIVATGPSLTLNDLEMIKDEYSFGMNSVVRTLDKTSWSPNFFMIEDEYVYDKLEQDITNFHQATKIPVIVGGVIPFRYPSAKEYYPYCLHYLDHKMYHRKGYGEFKFSDDCYNVVYDGYTVTMSVLQIACYMGFKKIYLLGCDCNYNQPKTHFIEYGHKDPKAAIMGDKMIEAHREFKKFADSIGVEVFNCTRGGMLEEYPRKSLETVLEEENENSSNSTDETE